MSGIELLTTIRNDPDCQHVSFLMTTCEFTEEKVRYAIEEGVDGYQIKPFSEERIINDIERILRIKLHPDSLQHKIQKLSTLHLNRKYDEALLFARENLNEEKHPNVSFILSRCYLAKKDYKNAQKYAQEVLEKRQDSRALHLLGEVCMAEEKYEEAIEYLKKASEMNPQTGLSETPESILHNPS